MRTKKAGLLLAVLAFYLPVEAQQQANSTSQTPAPEAVEPVDASFVPTVESRAQALEVISVTRHDPFLRIRLKNVSDKNICGFRMRYHKSGAAILFSYVMSDTKTTFAAGEVYRYESPFSTTSSLAREPLVFEAVIFEDGTGDGEEDKVKGLQNLFLTSRKELEHVMALVQASLSSPNVETVESLRELQTKMSQTPEYVNMAMLNGLVGITLPSWKGHAMGMISELLRRQQEGVVLNIREELVKLSEGFTKALARYPRAI
jgi:hypothetical protein